MNHFASACRYKSSHRPPPRNSDKQTYSRKNNKRNPDSQVHAIEEDFEDDFFIGSINNNVDAVDEADRTEVFADIVVNDHHSISMKLDTGAQVNILSESDYNNYADTLGPLEKANSKLHAYGGRWLDVRGTVRLKCTYGGTSDNLKFFVVSEEGPSILSLKSCEDMKLVKVLLSVEAKRICHSSKAEDMIKEYEHVFKGLGHMKEEYRIQVGDSVSPVIHAPRKLPIAMEEKVKLELQRMENLQVICKVDEPTQWVNSIVVVTKPSGDIRLCLDPADLNKAVRREHYKMPTIEDVTSKVAGHKYFTVLDDKSSYWQIPLDHESSLLTAFNTPFGRYRFLHLPFGIKSTSEVFQKRMDKAFEDLKDTHPIVDDILISGRTIQEHDENLKEALETASKKGIKLNVDKLQLCQTEVKFFGELLTSEGMKPDPEKIEAVRQMETPTCKKELEGYLGMFTYLAQYAPSLSEKTHVLRELIKNDSHWDWTSNHDRAFREIKDLITRSPGPVLQYFDRKKDVIPQVDASQNGVGAVLLQEKGPVAYASKAMTDSQRNYAQIEKEMMAIVFGCENFHHYLFGKSFKVISDHKPLETIFKKPLHAVPLRLQRMRIRLQMYDMTVQYTPGKEIPVADMLSRHFKETDKLLNINSLDDDVQAYVHMVISNLPISNDKMSDIRAATSQDTSLQAVAKYIHNGWPTPVKECVSETRDYWTFRDELSRVEGILFKGRKVIIPTVMREQMLERIHTGHMGMQKCKDRARDLLYWPRMSSDIERMVDLCSVCQQYRMMPSKEPMIPTDIPSLPWKMVATDVFHFSGREHLLVVDYYSRYIEIAALTNTKASSVITHMKSIFARHGVPDKVISDNGPQYASSEFKQFSRSYDFKHVTSSPTYPQANGLAEKSVETVKRMLLKAKERNEDPYLSLLAYRNTPVCALGSPAQLLMSRRLNTNLPCHNEMLQPKVVNPENVRKAITEARMYQKQYYDRTSKVRQPLYPDGKVRVKLGRDWVPATITKSADTPRSYHLKTMNGVAYRRNRRDINPTKELFQTNQQHLNQRPAHR
ncbi:uncharacterized protein K02A2.6-like [Haliotis rubra]|uniref:uncharacterized protein K02A2.6-like n=1 Tax=Haliotis rubra TaxID=36100 RepID=UPI001EE5E997|nr:uncharacterized protein K02A2.6-like [Haliotis rubra]